MLRNVLSFNSLQTGKCIARRRLQVVDGPQMGFNSLQTGKCIARRSGERDVARYVWVSIPFKRESV